MARDAIPQHGLLTRVEAAAVLNIPPATLAQWAYRGEGPPFYRVGRHCRYDADELRAWLDQQRVGTPA